MKYVIIGNGAAAVHAAESIRRTDARSAICMIADEMFSPYCRPMISMVLEGAAGPEKLPIRDEKFYEKYKITLIPGRRVIRLDTENRRVFLPNDRKGEESVSFDRLLIASGADPRPVKAGGMNLENIFYMRTRAHVQNMLAVLPSVKKALVLGGGLVGFKAAYGLLRRGISVSMLIRSDYPLSMQLDETAGKIILDELVQNGLDVRVGVEVKAFSGKRAVQAARLSDGSELPCHMAVIGKGVLPAHSFVPKDKIRTELGIMVDARMETNVPGIFAAGDVAQCIDIARQTGWVNAIWPEAVNQGRIAGFNMAGREIHCKGSLSRNVMRIFSRDIMTAGIVNPAEKEGTEIISRGDVRKKTYRKLLFRKDRLVGMVLVGDIEQGGLLMSLIQNKIPIRIHRECLLSSAFNYAQLLI